MEHVHRTKSREKGQRSFHVQGLDALRTLAIFGVTLFHLFPQVVCGGYIGVSLFFVLTGYLLAYTCEYRRIEGSFDVISYYIKRIRRIYPSLLIVILLTVGIYYLLAPKAIETIRNEVLSVLLGYNNWWQMAQNADYFTRMANQSPFTHLWFLGIEIQYYVLWPVIFFLYIGISQVYNCKTGITAIAVCGLLSSVYMPFLFQSGADITRLYYGTDTRMYALLLGSAIGLYQTHAARDQYRKKGHPGSKFILFCLTIGCTVVSYFLMDGQSPYTYQVGMFAMTIIFCLMILLMTDPDLRIGHLFERPVFQWIGKKSYGIFLWQYPVIFFFQYKQWNKPAVWKSLGMPAELVYVVPVLEVVLIVLLTIWMDFMLNWFTGFRQVSFLQRRLVVRSLMIFLLSMPGFVMMGYGCKGIIESANEKQSAIALKEQMLKNEEALKAQDSQQAAQTGQNASLQSVDLRGIACIGDSVMLGSAMEIKNVLPDCYIDAKTSRYVGAGLGIAQSMEASQKLGNIVLIALGTNGPLDGQYEEQTQNLLKYLGPNRRIFWVNVYCPNTGWQDSNNAYLEKIAKQYPNVTLIDWCGLISKHPEWLVEDGIHPNDEGTKQYAKLIQQSMVAALQKK